MEAENAVDAVLDTMLPRSMAAENLAALERTVFEIARENTPAGLAAMLRGMAMRDDAHDIAAELSMPVTVIAGAEDRGISLDEARASAASFPHADLVVLERVGHLPMLEDPAGLERALRALLAR